MAKEWLYMLGLYLLAANLVAFFLMGMDKRRARKDKRRIPGDRRKVCVNDVK